MATLAPLLILGLLFLLLVILDRLLSSLTATSIRQQRKDICEAWSNLAASSGLTFNPKADFLPTHGPSTQPAITGTYRSRQFAIGTLISGGDRDNGVPPNVYLIITLHLHNPSRFSLTIREKGVRASADGLCQATTGNVAFDRRFAVGGQPPDFRHQASILVAELATTKLTGPSNAVMRSHPDLSGWSRALWAPPSVELEASELVWTQQGILRNADDQVAVLDLLCELAAFTDQSIASL